MEFEIVDTLKGKSIIGSEIPVGTVFMGMVCGDTLACIKSYDGTRISVINSQMLDDGDYYENGDSVLFDNYRVVNKITVEV